MMKEPIFANILIGYCCSRFLNAKQEGMVCDRVHFRISFGGGGGGVGGQKHPPPEINPVQLFIANRASSVYTQQFI